MPSPFDKWGYNDARKPFDNRRVNFGASNHEFYKGNHFQNGEGFIGQMPPKDENYARKILEIEAGFQPENVIADIVDTHTGGLFGREPIADFVQRVKTPRRRTLSRRRPQAPRPAPQLAAVLPPEEKRDPLADEADDALTEWWDVRDVLTALRAACHGTLLEGIAVLRLYVPPGLRDESGMIPKQESLSDAIKYVHIEVLTPDVAGVFLDADTRKEVGVYLYTKDNLNYAELTYLDDNGRTIVRQVGAGGENAGQPTVYDLGGRLTIYEVRRPLLITQPIRQNQKALNLTLTQMMRNVNLAGSRERYFMNAEPPGKWVTAAGADWQEGISTGAKVWQAAPFYTGPGTVSFPKGRPIYDETGQEVGLTNPNLNVLEPVPVDSFTGTRDTFRSVMYGQCHMKHMLIADDPTVSGRSRDQARGEYEGDLNLSKGAFDGAGRCVAEVPVYFAAQFCSRSTDFLALRAEFNTLISTGPIDPLERQENRADVEAGLLSKETARSRGGVDDPQAEQERIEEEQARAAELAPESAEDEEKQPAEKKAA